MKHFLKTQKIWIIIFSVIGLATLLSITIKTKYEVTTPAVISDVNKFIYFKENEKIETKPDINTVSVYSFPRASLLNYAIGYLNPFAELTKIQDQYNTDDDYIVAQGNLHKDISYDNSIIAGYEIAKKKNQDLECQVNYDFNGYAVTTILNSCQSALKVNDRIVEINGIVLSMELTPGKVIKELSSNGVSEFKAKVKYFDDNDVLQTRSVKLLYDDEGSFGFACDAYNQVTSTKNPSIDPSAEDNINSLGPSGGLMQALLVYEQITGCKLTKGLKIAGTGTIDINGNAGLIGGMKQKIYIANACNVDIFFVPIDMSLEYDNNEDTNAYLNWEEAQEAKELLKKLGQTKMKIVPVKNLEEVIDYLEGLE